LSNTDRLAEEMYQRAVTAAKAGATDVKALQAACRLSYGGAQQFLERMQAEGILTIEQQPLPAATA
jgi:hypothetical protein